MSLFTIGFRSANRGMAEENMQSASRLMANVRLTWLDATNDITGWEHPQEGEVAKNPYNHEQWNGTWTGTTTITLLRLAHGDAVNLVVGRQQYQLCYSGFTMVTL